MVQAFVSYIREDALAANWIASELKAIGVSVWLDANRIKGGQAWRDEIARAIDQSDYFIPILSSGWLSRERSVAQDELEYAQKRSVPWFAKHPRIIPIRLDGCNLSEIDARLRRSISNLHVVSFEGRALWDSLRDLATAVGCDSIRIDHAEPLALGLPTRLVITNGAIKTELTEPIQPQILGLEKQIMNGELFRAFDETIRLHMTMRAPFTEGHDFDKNNGLDIVSTQASDRYVSLKEGQPTSFVQTYDFVLPKRSFAAMRHMGLGPYDNDTRVQVETCFRLVASAKSIHGVVDTFVKASGGEVELEFKQWAIMQAACVAAPSV